MSYRWTKSSEQRLRNAVRAYNAALTNRANELRKLGVNPEHILPERTSVQAIRKRIHSSADFRNIVGYKNDLAHNRTSELTRVLKKANPHALDIVVSTKTGEITTNYALKEDAYKQNRGTHKRSIPSVASNKNIITLQTPVEEDKPKKPRTNVEQIREALSRGITRESLGDLSQYSMSTPVQKIEKYSKHDMNELSKLLDEITINEVINDINENHKKVEESNRYIQDDYPELYVSYKSEEGEEETSEEPEEETTEELDDIDTLRNLLTTLEDDGKIAWWKEEGTYQKTESEEFISLAQDMTQQEAYQEMMEMMDTLQDPTYSYYFTDNYAIYKELYDLSTNWATNPDMERFTAVYDKYIQELEDAYNLRDYFENEPDEDWDY